MHKKQLGITDVLDGERKKEIWLDSKEGIFYERGSGIALPTCWFYDVKGVGK